MSAVYRKAHWETKKQFYLSEIFCFRAIRVFSGWFELGSWVDDEQV